MVRKSVRIVKKKPILTPSKANTSELSPKKIPEGEPSEKTTDMGSGKVLKSTKVVKEGRKRPINTGESHTDSDSEISIVKCIKVETPQTLRLLTSEPGNSVQVLGTDLVYRQHGDAVLFSTSSVMELLAAVLPLASDSLSSVVPGSQEAGDKKARKAFISWTSLSGLLNGGLLDLAVRDLLVSDGRDGTLPTPSLQGDFMVIRDTEVKFKVRGGKVYLEVISAFTALDRLQEALEGSWHKVDEQLAKKGISQKTAFKKRSCGTERSYLTLEAYKVLCTGHLAGEQVDRVVLLVDQLLTKKTNIVQEIQQTVDMILRTSCITPLVATRRCSPPPGEQPTPPLSPQLGHKYCANSLCGRGYHFVMQCCRRSHVMELGHHEVGFIRKKGRIFLEKCSAFGALGRMYVIRCSDYRKADKILLEHGSGQDQTSMVEQQFLFEHDDVNLGRNRRTHISLEAFIILVNDEFADPSKTESLLHSIDKIKKSGEETLSKCLEVSDSVVIDLSDNEEFQCKQEVVNLDGNSSGFDSEAPVNPQDEYGAENDSKTTISLLGVSVNLKIVDNKPFLGKTTVLKLIDSPQLMQKGHRILDRLLEESGVCLDDAFLYEGRQRGFISVAALKVVLNSEGFEDQKLLRDEILKLEENSSSLHDCRILLLKSSDTMKYKVVGDTVFLDTIKLLKLSGFCLSNQTPSKAYLLICKILTERGLNTNHCFLRQGKSKYSMISVAAALTLLRSKVGPLKDVARTVKLTEDIIEALTEKKLADISSNEPTGENQIQIGADFPAIRFKVQTGQLFLHRKTCFECLGLESAVLTSKKGYSAVNSILVSGGVNLATAYIATKQQRYSFINCFALIYLLQCRDPLIVCLPNKEKFLGSLLRVIQAGAITQMAGDTTQLKWCVGETKDELEVRSERGQLYVQRQSAYTLSGLINKMEGVAKDPREVLSDRGLEANSYFLPDGEDDLAWLSLHCLFVLMSAEGTGEGGGGGDSYHTVAWRDLLSAVAMQEPRLRTHMKMERFKKDLLSRLLQFFVQSLSADECSKESTDESGVEMDTIELVTDTDFIYKNKFVDTRDVCVNDANDNHDHVVPGSGLPSPSDSFIQSPSTSCLPSPTGSDDMASMWQDSPSFPLITPERYSKLRSDILEATGGLGGTIGDWELIRADTLTKLNVKPGYGASRKISFLQPDYAAILRYSVTLGEGRCQLTINNSVISPDVLDVILARGEREGTLSLLYQLISLRPCFGCFSPELVETVKQWGETAMELEKITVDTSFIGTSSSGRTYAGTVRSTDCGLLAGNRVSDRCSECTKLDRLTINRSLLGEQTVPHKETVEQAGKGSQQSVWQLATTSQDGCSFVCPQAQSFNTSLPHAFDSAAQASSVVQHRVEISNGMNVVVELSGRLVTANFPDFVRDRQLGPLLDWVAGLRLCVGYPASQLVKQAAFILENLNSLRPDLKKLFKFLVVDHEFHYRREQEEELSGTIRAASCLVTSEQGADICQQCRLLQEPIEFLAV